MKGSAGEGFLVRAVGWCFGMFIILLFGAAMAVFWVSLVATIGLLLGSVLSLIGLVSVPAGMLLVWAGYSFCAFVVSAVIYAGGVIIFQTL